MTVEISYIQTLDGMTKVEWWDKDKFHGRVTQVISSSGTQTIPIPDDTILCDICNTQITGFPVPVVWGSYALCKECLEGMTKKGGETNGRSET